MGTTDAINFEKDTIAALMNGENSNTTQNLGALQLKFLREQDLMLVTFVGENFIEKT